MALPVSLIAVALIILIAIKVTYEILLSPLRHFPGPLLASFTEAYRATLTAFGNIETHQRQWHDKWGRAVRVGPNVISLSDPDMIRVVYTSKNSWRKV